MKWLRDIGNWLSRVFRSDQPFAVVRVEDAQDEVKPSVIYIIGDTHAPWAASFLCPCGCGETISLSLIPTDRPSWHARIQKDGLITLSPSIWRTKGCRSHFFIRNGRVVWAKAARH